MHCDRRSLVSDPARADGVPVPVLPKRRRNASRSCVTFRLSPRQADAFYVFAAGVRTLALVATIYAGIVIGLELRRIGTVRMRWVVLGLGCILMIGLFTQALGMLSTPLNVRVLGYIRLSEVILAGRMAWWNPWARRRTFELHTASGFDLRRVFRRANAWTLRDRNMVMTTQIRIAMRTLRRHYNAAPPGTELNVELRPFFPDDALRDFVERLGFTQFRLPWWCVAVRLLTFLIASVELWLMQVVRTGCLDSLGWPSCYGWSARAADLFSSRVLPSSSVTLPLGNDTEHGVTGT